jgi:hypothetical protein
MMLASSLERHLYAYAECILFIGFRRIYSIVSRETIAGEFEKATIEHTAMIISTHLFFPQK